MSRVLSDRVNGWLFFCLSVFQVGATRVAVPDQRIFFELEGPPPPHPIWLEVAISPFLL
jgi:hypothetical protein